MPHSERRCLGLFGMFDIDDLDVQLRVRVAVHELQRRRPDLALRLFAPFGSTRPLPVAADLAVEPLAPLSTERVDALVEELAAAIVIGDAPADPSTAYPGHPAVDPRDVTECLALLAALPPALPNGLDPDEPHPALLARRVWSYGVCEQRREFLRAMHWWPQRGAAVVIAGSDADLPYTDELTARLRLGDRAIAVVGTGIADGKFASTITAQLQRRPAHLIPAARSSIEDRVAAIAGASAVVTSDRSVLALADAFGRPRRTIEAFATAPASRAAKRSSPTFQRDERVLDGAYDALAALVTGEAAPVLAGGEITALRDALGAQARRVAHERVVLADYVRAVRNNAAQEAEALRAELAERPIDRIRDVLRRRRG